MGPRVQIISHVQEIIQAKCLHLKTSYLIGSLIVVSLLVAATEIAVMRRACTLKINGFLSFARGNMGKVVRSFLRTLLH